MAYTINDLRGTDNVQKAYEYEVDFIGSTSSGSVPLMTTRVESVSIPEESVETFIINFKGQKTTYSGRVASAKTVTVNFWDDETRQTYKFFRNWLDTMMNPIVGGGVTRELAKGQMVIKLFASDSQTVMSAHTLDVVYPTQVSEISLDYANSDVLKFSVTFSYDTHVIA
jgi:phage gp36-like protein